MNGLIIISANEFHTPIEVKTGISKIIFVTQAVLYSLDIFKMQ